MEKINYLALLQGINAGGKNTFKMNELKSIFENIEFTDVETYIQSGNVFFKDYEKDKTKLANNIKKTLLEKTHNEIQVLVLTLNDIKNIIKDIPKDFGLDSEKYKYDILFLIESLTSKEIMNNIKITEEEDKIYEGEKALYVKRYAKKLTGSYIVKALHISPNITVRNLKVTKKLYELMVERNGV
jgi:uncharacterized protein (DUF1697 family)